MDDIAQGQMVKVPSETYISHSMGMILVKQRSAEAGKQDGAMTIASAIPNPRLTGGPCPWLELITLCHDNAVQIHLQN